MFSERCDKRPALVLLLSMVCMSLPAVAQDKRAIVPALKHDMAVEITTHLGDDQEFRQGDELTFLVNLSQAAYLTVVFQDASGKLVQILPNRDRHVNLFEPGSYFMLPDAQDPFRYRVASPFGSETVYIYASDQPLPEIDGKYLDNGLRLLDGNYQDLQQYLQALQREQGLTIVSGSTRITTRP